MKININVDELNRLADNVNLASNELKPEVEKALEQAGSAVRSEARGLVPVDTGELKKSISVMVKDANPMSVEVGPDVNYGADVEFGTKPHAVSAGALSGWAKRKGLNPYAVAKSIEKKGTKAQPYLIPGLKNAETLIEQAFTRMAQRIIMFLSK